MTLTDNMNWKTYSDAFWEPDFRSVAGAEALAKRNTEGKKVCSEFEDYLRKRSKLEAEYSKSLAGLTKCFRDKAAIGVLESSFCVLKDEITAISRAHQIASERLQKQADELKKFKDQQTGTKKNIESVLQKTQEIKLSQHTKMLQLQKAYVKKSVERDNAEANCKAISISAEASPKDQEKARNKAIKTDEEATKADTNYKGAILTLEDARLQWEHEMLHTCQVCQELDEERITFLRRELWFTVNLESKLCLDIDDSCERIREVLEKCDIITDIQSFIESAATGSDHPEPLTFQHYSKLTSGSEGDNISLNDTYSTIADSSSVADSQPSKSGVMTTTSSNAGGAGGRGHAKKGIMNILTLRNKKKPSVPDEFS